MPAPTYPTLKAFDEELFIFYRIVNEDEESRSRKRISHRNNSEWLR
jgi:hypothetical protein